MNDSPYWIKIYDREAFESMRNVGRIVSRVLDMVEEAIRPGVTTSDLDDLVFRFAMDHDLVPATLNYRGFKYSICTSINHVVCHGMPSDRRLREGDIINVDVTLIQNGWHGDASRMYAVGHVKPSAQRLIEVTHEALMRGIEVIKPGAKTGDIGAAIQKHAESAGMSVVREFCGHGIGRSFHELPNILHYGESGTGDELKSGMIFTVEPMLNLGRPGVKILPDGWTAITQDRSLSAQFEHSVGVTDDGVEIFTLPTVKNR